MAEYTSKYNQDFTYDEIGNMTSKLSSSSTSPNKSVGDNLNYNYAYSYYANKAHQAEKIGNLYYRYDGNGNVIEEREGGHGTSEVLAGTVYSSGDLRMTDTGFGIVRTQDSSSGSSGKTVYSRSYAWDEENRLIRSVDNAIAVDYRYGADGQRAAKYSKNGESLYFDSMWSCQTDYPDLRQMKSIYVGQSRIATRLNISGDNSTGYEKQNTYYYHPDHLGSAQLVTDYQGKEYERIEYTPYGETWIEKASDGLDLLPYKFTGKELDSETGLYYYGARYLNPKTSNWLSADPALGDYIPSAPVDEEARKHNGNLPGMGGVFNLVNLALYHYAGNNPVKYTDPDGRRLSADGDDPSDITYKGSDRKMENQKTTSKSGPTTPSTQQEKIEGLMKSSASEAYTKGNQCDDWLQKNFDAGGMNIDAIWGNASDIDATGHADILGGKDLLSDKPDQGLSIFFVAWGDDKSPDHVGAIDLHSDGSVTIYNHGGGKNDSVPFNYNSLDTFLARPAWKGTYSFWNPWGKK